MPTQERPKCAHCGVMKSRDQFAPQRIRKDSTCLQCKKEKKHECWIKRKDLPRVRASTREAAIRHYWRNSERLRAKSRQYGRNILENKPEKALFNSARQRAREKGLDFQIEVSDIVIPRVCPVFGIKLKPMRGGDGDWQCAPTVDRINSNIGYLKSNIVVISRKANMIKSYGTAGEHRKIAEWMEGPAGRAAVL